MARHLWSKILAILLVVSMVSLASAYALRTMMIGDFQEYREGEMLDRAQWLTATIEKSYEKTSDWSKNDIADNIVNALMAGLDITVRDAGGNRIMDAPEALDRLTPSMKRRVLGTMAAQRLGSRGPALTFPLFSEGKEIGSVDVSFLERQKDLTFIDQADRLLFASLLGTAFIVIILSVFLSRKIALPINALSAASQAISEGELTTRVAVDGKDEIARLADTFNLMADNLERQDTLRKKLITDVAHELRTPVAALRGELEAMIDGIIPLGRTQLQSLHEEIGRLATLIEGIEDLSQAEARVFSVHKDWIQLHPFISHIIKRFRPLFDAKGVRIDFTCDESEGISADPDALSRILINLINNALAATVKDDTVFITATRSGSRSIIEIRDSGRGIPAEGLPFIFERFYSTAPAGLGIGLAIVKELAEAQGGTIEATSEESNGATFTLSLPLLHNNS